MRNEVHFSQANALIGEPDQAASLCDNPRWMLVLRVVASPSFASSPLLSKFLLYVSERTLTGRTEEISEHQIGVNVFGRRPHYNSGEDNIVRNYARQLRRRLEVYFQDSGREQGWRLEIPRGGYIPLFTWCEGNALPSEKAAPAPVPAETPTVSASPAGRPPERRTSRTRPFLRAAVVASVCLLLAGASALVLIRRPVRPSPAHLLWTQMFKAQQTTIVPSDDTIVMFQNLTHRSVDLDSYLDRSYVANASLARVDAGNMLDLEAQRYTSMADLNAVIAIIKRPEAANAPVVIRYARELQMNDLKNGNVILLGSSFSNPWVELFEKHMNFVFSYAPEPNHSLIRNLHPLPGEAATYVNNAGLPSHKTYAVVALLPNLNGTGQVLLVEGLTMAGTQAAIEFLSDDLKMQSVLKRAESADGTILPFEVLLETQSFESSSPQATVLTSRIDGVQDRASSL